jgi:translation initiation factor 3 subunit I
MRPIALKGHERSITSVKFNREGDLLFSTSKSYSFAVWRTENGERIGTYNGHSGAIWSVDVDRKSKYVISGAADNTARLWEAETGKEVHRWIHQTPIRSVEFSFGNKQVLAVTDSVLGKLATIFIYEMEDDIRELSSKPVLDIVSRGEGKVLQATWGPLNKTILAAGEDGKVHVYDAKNGTVVKVISDHSKAVMNIAWNPQKTLFATCSKDGHCHLYDADTYERLKTYTTGRPINACSISPTRPEIICGGGQSAESVTVTRVDSAQFKVKFFNMIFEEDMGAVPGHFGPVNALAYFPDGKGFVSGGEDGFVRIHHFDAAYFKEFNIQED